MHSETQVLAICIGEDAVKLILMMHNRVISPVAVAVDPVST